MRKLFLGLAAASLALSGCGVARLANLPASPAAVANATVLDEQVASGVELAYKAARTLMELAVDTGRLKGARAAQVQAYNRKAYDAVKATRTAYRTGNAAGYFAAAKEARALVAQMLALI